jgi:uncharacterized membrane protein
MARIETKLEIDVPVRQVYAQLMRFDEYPRFMECVEEVRSLDGNRLYWRSRPDGTLHEWESVLTAQEQDLRLAWHNLTDHKNDGSVELTALGPKKTQLWLQMEIDPVGNEAFVRAHVEELRSRSHADMQRLKNLLETGAQGFTAEPELADLPGARVPLAERK